MSEKTNVMRLLDQKKIPYKEFYYNGEGLSGEQIAEVLNEPVERVFKTLVTVSKSGKNYVFMVPVAEELDLKRAAKAVSEKSIDMIKSKELLPLTGYIHGGCSPIGMKKSFPTVIDETANNFDKIFFSAGRVGAQVEVSVKDLQKAVRLTFESITVREETL